MQSDFSNQQINLENLPAFDQVRYKSIEPQYWNVIVMNLSLISVLLLIGCVISFVSTSQDSENTILRVVLHFGGFLLLVGFLFWVNYQSFKRRCFAVRERDIQFKSGWIQMRTVIVPFNRVQHIVVQEGIFSRAYDLATLVIYTGGESGSDLVLAGLPKQEAGRLKSYILDYVSNLKEEESAVVAVLDESETTTNTTQASSEHE